MELLTFGGVILPCFGPYLLYFCVRICTGAVKFVIGSFNNLYFFSGSNLSIQAGLDGGRVGNSISPLKQSYILYIPKESGPITCTSQTEENDLESLVVPILHA
jgi:hypothetical protein